MGVVCVYASIVARPPRLYETKPNQHEKTVSIVFFSSLLQHTSTAHTHTHSFFVCVAPAAAWQCIPPGFPPPFFAAPDQMYIIGCGAAAAAAVCEVRQFGRAAALRPHTNNASRTHAHTECINSLVAYVVRVCCGAVCTSGLPGTPL